MGGSTELTYSSTMAELGFWPRPGAVQEVSESLEALNEALGRLLGEEANAQEPSF